MVVVGGIYSPNHHSSRWLFCLLTGSPDSLVPTRHYTVHSSVCATLADRWGLELLTVEFNRPCGASDSPVAHRTVRCDLTSQVASDLLTLQTAVAVDHWQSRPLLVDSPDSPVHTRQSNEF
jgi:hypothetical protein